MLVFFLQVNIYYVSGKKFVIIVFEEYKSICKVFVDYSFNIDQIIVENIVK